MNLKDMFTFLAGATGLISVLGIVALIDDRDLKFKYGLTALIIICLIFGSLAAGWKG